MVINRSLVSNSWTNFCVGSITPIVCRMSVTNCQRFCVQIFAPGCWKMLLNHRWSTVMLSLCWCWHRKSFDKSIRNFFPMVSDRRFSRSDWQIFCGCWCCRTRHLVDWYWRRLYGRWSVDYFDRKCPRKFEHSSTYTAVHWSKFCCNFVRTSIQFLCRLQSLLDNANERILNGMIFRYLMSRGYYDQSSENQPIQTWSDEEEERERLDGGVDGVKKSRTLAPSNILKIIN